jgi:hypothetical protein
MSACADYLYRGLRGCKHTEAARAVRGEYGDRAAWSAELSRAVRNRERLKPREGKNAALYSDDWEVQFAALLRGEKSISRTAPATSAEAAGAGRRASEENTDQGAYHGADTESAVIIPPLFSLSAAAVFSAGDGGVVVVALYPERPRTYFELSPPPAKGQASIVLCSGMRLLGITLAELGPSVSERRLLFWSPLSRIPFVSLGALQRAGKRGNARTPGRGRDRL